MLRLTKVAIGLLVVSALCLATAQVGLAAPLSPVELFGPESARASELSLETVFSSPISPLPVVQVSVSPQTQSVESGRETTAEIWIEDVENLAGYELTLDFGESVRVKDDDPATEGTQVTLGSILPNGFVAVNEVDNVARQIHVAVAQVGGESATGGGSLVVITFESTAPGIANLIVSGLELLNNDATAFPYEVQDGQITVIPNPIVVGLCRLQGRTDYTGCTIEIAGRSATTNAQGQFELAVLSGEYQATASMLGYLSSSTVVYASPPGTSVQLPVVTLRAGDLDNDGRVRINDLAIIGWAYGEQCPSLNDPRADVNGDCLVDLRDLVLTSVNYGLNSPQPWTSEE